MAVTEGRPEWAMLARPSPGQRGQDYGMGAPYEQPGAGGAPHLPLRVAVASMTLTQPLTIAAARTAAATQDGGRR